MLLLCLVTFGCRTVPLPPKTVGVTTPAQEPPAPPPPPLTTPQESLAAKPSWVEAGSYAPQYFRALPLSTQADREVSKALLSCTVDTRRNLDTFGWNDLLMEAQFGDAPPLVAQGPEDSMRMTFTAPLLTLRAGDGFRFHIVDRDVTTREPIVTIRDVFDGRLPLVASREEATVECDVVPTPVVHKQVAARVRDVQAELRLLRPAVPLPVESDWGHSGRMRGIERLVEDTAALVGWADPRVASLLEAVASEKAKMLAAATQWIDQQLQDGTPPGQAQTVIDAVLKARVLEVSCEAQPGTEECRFMTRLELTNLTDAGLEVSLVDPRTELPSETRGQIQLKIAARGADLGFPTLMRASGRRLIAAAGREPFRLPVGKSVTLWLAANWPQGGSPHPSLLLFERDTARGVLRLE